MNTIVAVGILGLFLTIGCISAENQTQVSDAMMEKTGDVMEKDNAMEKTDNTMEKDGNSMMEKEGEAMEKTGDAMEKPDVMVKGLAYQPFSQAAYDQAKADGKTIFLEFYANWCPTCKAQDPALRSGLSKIESDNLVAFQVNYKDSETDADEQALAQKFNITYQHTHVVTNTSEETLLKSQENWSEQDVIEKIGAFA